MCWQRSGLEYLSGLSVLLAFPVLAAAQATLGFAGLRPFVISVVPVVDGGGAVGGVQIDIEGALQRSDEFGLQRLADARHDALAPVVGDVAEASALRKVSLARLDGVLRVAMRDMRPLPDEVRYLAGLQSIEYVFAYPAAGDIVLAGRAEGWRVDAAGTVVGRDSLGRCCCSSTCSRPCARWKLSSPARPLAARSIQPPMDCVVSPGWWLRAAHRQNRPPLACWKRWSVPSKSASLAFRLTVTSHA